MTICVFLPGNVRFDHKMWMRLKKGELIVDKFVDKQHFVWIIPSNQTD